MSSKPSAQSVEQTLRIFQDKDELTTLMNRYCTVSDTKDFQGYADCYATDGTLAFERLHTTTGRVAIEEKVRISLERYEATQHSMTNMQFNLDSKDPNKATGSAYLFLTATPVLNKPGENYSFGGPYRWQFVRTDEGWRLAHLHLTVAWSRGVDVKGGFVDTDKESNKAWKY